MLFHQKPETVLVLSGGAGGMIHEILKHPVSRVDYVELDPLLLKLIQKFPTPLTQSELSDQRVNIHDIDGRFFVNKTQNRFDLIFIGLSAPQELQTNRLFTSEFFSVAKKRMNPGGIIVLTLPGSLTYLSAELKDLNGCILNTLKGVYRSVRIIAGDATLYLASDSEKLERVKQGEIIRRLEERKIYPIPAPREVAHLVLKIDRGRTSPDQFRLPALGCFFSSLVLERPLLSLSDGNVQVGRGIESEADLDPDSPLYDDLAHPL
jgi:spermidine synthase